MHYRIIILLIISISFFSCKKQDSGSAKNNQNTAAKSDNAKVKKKTSPKKINYPDYLNIDFLMGKFDPSMHNNFVKIADKYTNKHNIYLDKKTYEAFLRMYKAAYKDGFKLIIISATRPFNYQKRIWERNWKKRKNIKNPEKRALDILKFSSMPGTSRHHWGTEIDLNVLDNSYYTKGKGKKIYDWLEKNAKKYGFCRPYTAGRPYGYNEEKWHWSYKPLSKIYTRYAKENMKDEYIKGFSGSTTAKNIEVTKKYILGINPDCMK